MLSSTPEKIHPVLSRLYHILYKEKLSPEEIKIATKLISFMTIEKKEESEAALYQKLSEDIGETIKPSGILDINKAGHKNGRTALISAVYHGHFSFVQRLLDAKANPNQRNEVSGAFPLISAATMNRIEITALLLEIKANPDQGNDKEKGVTPLMHACNQGHTGVARLLLKAKATINQYRFDTTPLLLAVENGKVEMTELLLDAKADPNQCNKKTGFSALEYATIPESTETCQLLLENKADPLQVNTHGSIALLQASIAGNVKVAALLLEVKSDIETKTLDNFTSLDLAISFKKLEMVVFLLMRGAKIHDFGNLSQFLSEVDQLDENVLQCLKILHKPSDEKISRIPVNEQKTAKLYMEKLEVLQTVCQQGNLEMKKHFIDLTNEVLPKVLGEVIFSYDGRNFKPNSKVTFFQSETIDPALQDLQNQMEAEGIKLQNM